ncbi:MAG TPA: DUF4267 domain-containing protein [Chloroflexota bacterium]|nr:DUF4267 domain-containing protein [Chloroflexota bacterium]
MLGVSTIAFGIGPLIAPRLFCRLFGVPYQADKSGAAMPIRAVGWRDLVNGIGLLLDTEHARSWLWLRFAFDAGDVVTTLSSLRPKEDLKPARLAALAASATVFDAVLLLLTAEGAS